MRKDNCPMPPLRRKTGKRFSRASKRRRSKKANSRSRMRTFGASQRLLQYAINFCEDESIPSYEEIKSFIVKTALEEANMSCDDDIVHEIKQKITKEVVSDCKDTDLTCWNPEFLQEVVDAVNNKHKENETKKQIEIDEFAEKIKQIKCIRKQVWGIDQ